MNTVNLVNLVSSYEGNGASCGARRTGSRPREKASWTLSTLSTMCQPAAIGLAAQARESLYGRLVLCARPALAVRNHRGRAMAHRFEIRKNKAGEFVAYFCHNAETIFWTEGYKSKASAQNAIDSILKNGPSAEVVDTTTA